MRENKEKQALGDLMIKPVQRIPRYELIVKVRSFEKTHNVQYSVLNTILMYIFAALGLTKAHPRRPSRPPLPTGRTKGHQATG